MSVAEAVMAALRYRPRLAFHAEHGETNLTAIAKSVGAPLRVAVARFDGMGDWVLTLPLLQELVACSDVASVDLVGPPSWRKLLTRSGQLQYIPYVRGTLLQPPPPGGLLGKIRAMSFIVGRQAFQDGSSHRHDFDVVVLPRWDTDLGQNARIWAAGTSSTVIGFDPRGVPSCSWEERREHVLLQGLVSENRAAVHELDHLSTMMAALGLPPHVKRGFGIDYFGVQDVPKRAVIVMHPLSNEPKRQWPIEYWRCLIREILRATDMRIEIIGSSAEKERLEVLSQVEPRRVSLRAGEPLDRLPGLLAGAAVFVGNDSGPAHVAGAVDVPTVVISPHPIDGDPGHRNSPVRFAPAASRLWVLQPEEGLGRCKHACHAKTAHCIKQISPLQVSEAVMEAVTSAGAK